MRKLFNLLTMFGPLSAAKFWVAIILAVAQFIRVYTGYDLGLDEATITAVLGGIGALLVWWVPNKAPEPTAADKAKFPPAPSGTGMW